jgi:hypothetical protein
MGGINSLTHGGGRSNWRAPVAGILSIVAVVATPNASIADEGGVSFWLPGIYGSLAAVPQQPGWSLGTVYYHTSVDASGAVSAARQVTHGQLTANVSGTLTGQLNASADLALIVPTYTLATPVLGGQLALGMMAVTGRMKADVDATLTGSVGPFGFTKSGSFGDSVSGFGDLYPQATMRWNQGVHNFMAYATGDIPVGAYDPTRLANLGIGHGAIDGGAGYTYLNPQTGQEFSAVGGLTYNFKNTDTQYQNGVDFHLDGAFSQFLSKQFFVGVVGYTYQQVTADSGALPILGDFRSRVSALGPQIGYLFPVGNMQGYVNLKAYKEFDAANRPEGWNAWVTFAISPAAAPPPTPQSKLVRK